MMNRTCWSTSASGSPANASPHDQSVLGEHLQTCRAPVGGLLAIRGTAEALHRLAAGRFVTTVLAAVSVIGLSSLLP
jgi:hypothetical protein